MPLKLGKDNKGYYYQYGEQKKYYFKTELGKKQAFNKALNQMKAIYSNK
jgi:hypothetical protein